MFLRTALVCGAAAVAALLGAQGALAGPPAPPPRAPGPFANLQPGVASAGLNERVKVNVVFIGFTPGQVNTSAVPRRPAATLEADRPLAALLRRDRGARDRLRVRLRDDVHDPTWNTSFFTALKGLAKPAARTEFQDAYNEQDGTRKVGDNNFIDAPERREVADRPQPARRRHAQRHDLLHQLVGPARLHRPRLHQDRRARPRHGLRLRPRARQPQADRVGRHDARTTRRPASATAASTASGSTTSRPGPSRGAAATTSRTPTSTATASRTTASRRRGSTASGGYRAPSALTGDLARVARYAAINLLFTSSPLYPPYLTPGAPAERDRRPAQHVRGLASTSMRRSATRSPTSSSARSASSSPRCR